MIRQPIKSEWFERLRTTGLQKKYAWLAPFKSSVETVADFGCWSSEPFAVLWALDASKIVVVELDQDNLDKVSGPKEELENLSQISPVSLDGRKVEFIVADMTSQVEGLPSNHFDLAFCQDVLYMFGDDLQLVQSGVNEMTRTVKPSGWVIAVEPKIGADFEIISQELFGTKIDIQERISDPIDISDLFRAAGLIRYDLPDAPEWSYIYQKPSN